MQHICFSAEPIISHKGPYPWKRVSTSDDICKHCKHCKLLTSETDKCWSVTMERFTRPLALSPANKREGQSIFKPVADEKVSSLEPKTHRVWAQYCFPTALAGTILRYDIIHDSICRSERKRMVPTNSFQLNTVRC